MSAFQSPNYTQTPNDFFAMLPDMESSELRVTLVMIRHTFGYHRNGFKMGINKLAEAAGLSRNAAKDGAEAAEKRGTFKRTNPDEQTEAEWSLVVEDGQSVTTPGQPVEGGGSTSDSQVRVKETIKKELNNTPLSIKNAIATLAKNGVGGTTGGRHCARFQQPADHHSGTYCAALEFEQSRGR